MMHLHKALLFLSLLPHSGASDFYDEVDRRHLSLQHLARFIPMTQIADQASIDQDQALMIKYLDERTEESFKIARSVYEKGSFSRSYATLSLVKELSQEVKQGTVVHGLTVDGNPVLGEFLRPTPKGQTKLNILYDTTDSEVDYTGCRVGANPDPVTGGCFAGDGFVSFDAVNDGINETQDYQYYYSVANDNLNDRTIESMSRHAQYKMRPCGNCEYYKDFNRFVEYYGQPDYADKWIDTAFEGKSVSFKRGDWDFSHYSFQSRAEAIKRATVAMSIANYVSKQLSESFLKCLNKKPCTASGTCDLTPLRLMEGGVAFYAGSLEGQDGSGMGVLLYDLADRMCTAFRTCGENGDTTKGASKVNLEIMHEFFEMQQAIMADKCTAARTHQERIDALLYIPLFQATLKYAYTSANSPDASLDDEAAGAAYAASILPVVAKCHQDDAKIIYDNMKPNRGFKSDFVAVKGALERNYGCLRITCEDIGGYYYAGAVGGLGSQYYQGAEACASASAAVSQEPQSLSGWQIAGIVIASILAFLIFCLCCLFFTFRPRRSRRSAAATIPARGETV